MKYLPILLILITSLCVNIPIDLPLGGQNIIAQSDPYLQLNVQTIPTEIIPGRTLTLIFDITNNNNFDLDSVHIKAYDTCIFDDRGYTEETFSLKSNQSKSWTWEWGTDPTNLEKDCEIKIKAEYSANFSLYQDMVILTRDEYLARQMAGTLNSIPASSQKSKSPLNIVLTFPEEQPFMSGTNGYSMDIEYYNVGGGFLTVLDGDVVIKEGSYIDIVECAGGSVSDGKLNFINKKSSKKTCYFNIDDIGQPILIDSMSIEAKYSYVTDTFVSVKVKPGRTSS